jgi:hypothetical protein
MAHEAAIAAPAKCQRETVEQDGFAGAGFTGQHAQPVAKAQVEPVDQDDIAYRQMRQHGAQRRLKDRGMRNRTSHGIAWSRMQKAGEPALRESPARTLR